MALRGKISILARSFVAVCAMVFVLFASSASVFAADVCSYAIQEFKSEIVVNPDNEFNFSEVITINLPSDTPVDEAIDIERILPAEYMNRISKVKVNGYDFDYNQETNTISIHIDSKGTNNTLVLEIFYNAAGVDYLGEKADVCDLYILQAAHEFPVEKLEVKVTYPEAMKWNDLPADTEFGSWSADDNNHKLKFKGTMIPEGTGIELHNSLPVGYWANAVEIGVTKTISLFFLLAGIAVFLLMRIILRREHAIDLKEEHYPPTNLSPAHVGYMVDNVIDNTDITSMFYYLASKGYMTITEYERHKFSFTFNEYPKNETKSVRILFDAIFHKASKGSTVRLEESAPEIRRVLHKVKSNIRKDIFGGKNFYSFASKVCSIVSQLAFIAVVVALPVMNMMYIRKSGGDVSNGPIIVFSATLIMWVSLELLIRSYFRSLQRNSKFKSKQLLLTALIYVVLSALYVYFFRFAYLGRIGDVQVASATAIFLIVVPLMRIGMRIRSKANAALAGRIMGLQDFMNNCDKNTIKEISDSDQQYYFKLMPYAMVFNISRKFAGKFEYVDSAQPKWYKAYGVDENAPFDIVVMNSIIVNLPKQLNECVYPAPVN